MTFRRAISLACGFAGGSAVLVCAAVAADKRGYFADRRRLRETLAAVHAAQPPAWPTASGWDYNWDKRDPSSPVNGKRKESAGDAGSPDVENSKPKATRHIFLIRHSQYNLKGDGDKERILTPLEAVFGVKVDSELLFSSCYVIGVELMSCDLLREGAPIEPVPPVTHWKPEAVQYHEDGARIEAAFRRYIHRADPKQKEDSYEIIVCHANVIRYFVCRALQFPPEGWLRMGLNNGSITWLTIRPSGRVGLRALGDSGFMPPDKLTRT
uniref:Serine/threonine-protein phosphatase PGAM5, mitochondrial n=1 Tax=Cyprinus carpio TaxID=7962 RepID=A0A8C1YIW3_CYPCA